jgi:plasmid stability protein
MLLLQVAAAKQLLARVKRAAPHHSEVLAEVEHMIEAYITLAQAPINREERTEKKVPLELRKRKLCDLTRVPVITCHLPVNPMGQYPIGSYPHFRY